MSLGHEIVKGLRVKAEEAHGGLIMKGPGVCCSDCTGIFREWHPAEGFKWRKDTSVTLEFLGTY